MWYKVRLELMSYTASDICVLHQINSHLDWKQSLNVTCLNTSSIWNSNERFSRLSTLFVIPWTLKILFTSLNTSSIWDTNEWFSRLSTLFIVPWTLKIIFTKVHNSLKLKYHKYWYKQLMSNCMLCVSDCGEIVKPQQGQLLHPRRHGASTQKGNVMEVMRAETVLWQQVLVVLHPVRRSSGMVL